MTEKLMVMKKIRIPNNQHEMLQGILHEASSKKLALLCHGRLCTKDEHFLPGLAKALAKSGINAFRFDFSGNGQSGGKFEDATITKEISEIQCVAEYFAKDGYEIYSIIGHSKGAVDALLFQAKYGTAKSAVDIAGLANQEFETTKKYTKTQITELGKKGFFTIKYGAKTFKISKDYFDDRFGYGDIRAEVSKISAPTLIIHGTNDLDTPPASSKAIHSAITKSKLALIEGAGHFFAGKYEKRLIAEIVSWLACLY